MQPTTTKLKNLHIDDETALHVVTTMTPDAIFQALSLDLSVLAALLKSHRYSHGRTLYYRRISMALKAIQRHELLDFWVQLESFETNINQWSHQRKRKKQRKEEEQWDLKLRQKDEEQASLEQEFDHLLNETLSLQFPELVSRIQHASVALFMEVNRGFFLPFCTVALSALARVRVLILQIGRMGLTRLHEILQSNEPAEFIRFPQDTFEKAMEAFLETDKKETKIRKQTKYQILSSIGMTVRRPTRKEGNQSEEREHSTEDEKPDMDTSPTGDATIDRAEDDPSSKSATSVVDDDIGESMAFGHSEATKAPIGNDLKETKVNPPKADPLDRNMEIVASFKKKEKNKEKEKSKKRKETQPPKEKKKKKKSNKTKGDFFDNLFD
jgi:hypothetical protein